MASIRRTLSPVPRAGTCMNGEACQVPSPLSKSSTSSQNFQTSRGFLSSLLGLSDSQALLLNVFSPRSSKQPLDRSKPKGQVWRKALFHFLVCFVTGIFIGLTPFVSMNLSLNPMYNSQALSFEMVSTVRKFHTHKGMTENMTSLLERGGAENHTTLESVGKQVNLADGSSNDMNEELDLMVRKLLIVVTPTYARPFQAYYLNRLAYTLKLAKPPLLWIVVEMTSQSEQTADILRRSGVMYRHLVCKKNLTDVKDRNVHQRNVALSHIETHCLDGIVYFADDSNIYLADLFEHMRQFRRFGTWIVAKVTGSRSKGSLEGPICNGSRVIGWHAQDSSRRFRRFHADLSGFAFNSTILWDPKRWHRPTLEPIRLLDTVRDGFQASTFIEQVVEDESQMEGLLENCSRVMVWKLQLESLNSFYPPKWFTISNLDVTTQLA
ncbi:probable beta-1,4-xylosyltransferase IRX9H [Euphorbia lathyris]|uniref:probable beta-1,4-xylosyltransferase IRX9H n=1 Tax=Euphorbia lathyris TaxID=212925 RepID=UPI0033131E87